MEIKHDNTSNNSNGVVFVNGMFIKEVTNKEGVTFLNLSFKVEEFEKFLKEHENEDGFVNVTISNSKKTGNKYARLNTYKPSGK